MNKSNYHSDDGYDGGIHTFLESYYNKNIYYVYDSFGRHSERLVPYFIRGVNSLLFVTL